MAGPDERDDDLAELRRVLLDARDVEWEAPPPAVWDRIAAAVAAEPPRAVEEGLPPLRAVDARPTPVGRRAPKRLLALAAAAVVVVAGGALALTQASDGDDGEVVAATDLDPLGSAGAGRAEVVERDGVRRLRVDTSDVAAEAGAYLELWLLDADVTRFVSLGPLQADGVYELPPDVDVDDFPVVDISTEPVDGDPAHSGRSVLRGQLT